MAQVSATKRQFLKMDWCRVVFLAVRLIRAFLIPMRFICLSQQLRFTLVVLRHLTKFA